MINKVKHYAKIALRKTYRDQLRLQDEIISIQKLPRYLPSSTNLLGNPIKFVDNASFLSIYNEVIIRQIYNFKTYEDRPYIIDCGANIGLSVIYFKMLYPASEIVAFEPDPKVYKALVDNVKSFNFHNVSCINKGLWDKESVIKFYSEGADAGRIAQLNDKDSITSIDTIRLAPYLNRKVSFLKIDIEGAETTVLKDCFSELGNVENIFVEYHSFVGEKQTINELFNVLIESGFRVYVTAPDNVFDQPFVQRNSYHGMDMQVNIFASK